MKTNYSALAGIIGGMGPAASVYLQKLIVEFTPANRDQDHIPYLVYNNPQVPDRTQHLLGEGETPLPELIASSKLLKQSGATFIAFACNTSHAYVSELEKQAGLPVLNMISLTAEYVQKTYGGSAKVGVLATTGTIATKIYQKEFEKISKNIQVLVPSENDQKEVMKAIYDIKASKNTENTAKSLQNVAKKLILSGSDVIILGCTEIPLAIPPKLQEFPAIDPMEILAEEIIRKTLGN